MKFNLLLLLLQVFLVHAVTDNVVDVQNHLKTVTKTKTVYRTKTITATPLVTSTQRLNTVTVTQSVATSKTDRLFGVSMFLGDVGCNPATGRLLNSSAFGWNVLTSRGDLVANSCRQAYLSMIPGGQPVKATMKLQCRGKSSFLQIYSYGTWATTCDSSKVLNSLIFPNGYNCSARAVGYTPPFEMAITTDACGNKAVPVARAVNVTLEFANVFNLFETWRRGIGGNNFTNIQTANSSMTSLTSGGQVMILNNGILDTTNKSPVVYTLVAAPGSSSKPWKRLGKLVGSNQINPVMGIASLGKVGITSAGSWILKACLKTQPTICTNSNTIKIVSNDITKGIVLSQPKDGEVFDIFQPATGTADLGTKGPINVTWSDDYDNRGAMQDLLGHPAVARLNVTCVRADNVGEAKQVWSERAYWTATGYVEFHTMGNLKQGIEATFGKGSLGSSLEGWKCFGQAVLPFELFPDAPPIKTNTFLFQ